MCKQAALCTCSLYLMASGIFRPNTIIVCSAYDVHGRVWHQRQCQHASLEWCCTVFRWCTFILVLWRKYVA